MGTIYPRGNRLWIGFKDADGEWKYRSTGLKVGEEKLAQQALDEVERRITAGVEVVGTSTDHVTYNQYLDRRWLPRREAREIPNLPNDKSRLRDWVRPVIGDMAMREVRPRHLVKLVDRAYAAGKAPRTIRNIYSLVQASFRDAIIDEVVESSPCVLTEEQLGEIVDKDPNWRSTALYTREELELFLFDERIPEDRQVLYALEGVGACRHGEVAGLRWRDYDLTFEPLRRLAITRSYTSKRGTKTRRTRYMPVHPVLARKLDQWRAEGWARMMGREPTDDDLIVPCPARTKFKAGRMRDKNYSRKCLMEDFKVLGIRHRRGHDLRRTMISLARRDGARKDLLERCTHTPKRDTIDLYTEFDWASLCAEVAKLRIYVTERAPEPPDPHTEPPEAADHADAETLPSHCSAAEGSDSPADSGPSKPPITRDPGEVVERLTSILTTLARRIGSDPAKWSESELLRQLLLVEAPGIEPRKGRRSFTICRNCARSILRRRLQVREQWRIITPKGDPWPKLENPMHRDPLGQRRRLFPPRRARENVGDQPTLTRGCPLTQRPPGQALARRGARHPRG